MLLHEQKLDSDRICYYDSSNLLISKYNSDRKELSVIFKDGSQYVYKKVSSYTFNMLKKSKSQGKYLNQSIKGSFEYEKAPFKVDVIPILKNIKKLKEKNKEEKIEVTPEMTKFILDNPRLFIGLSEKEQHKLGLLYLELNKLIESSNYDESFKNLIYPKLLEVYVEKDSDVNLLHLTLNFKKYLDSKQPLDNFVNCYLNEGLYL